MFKFFFVVSGIYCSLEPNSLFLIFIYSSEFGGVEISVHFRDLSLRANLFSLPDLFIYVLTTILVSLNFSKVQHINDLLLTSKISLLLCNQLTVLECLVCKSSCFLQLTTFHCSGCQISLVQASAAVRPPHLIFRTKLLCHGYE